MFLCVKLRVCLLVVVTASALSAWAEDVHWKADPARVLYKRSAFAHGYIHGYEMGFHAGDFDFQMSRNAREIKKLKDYKSGKLYYAPQYGSREQFEKGYQEGFRVAYGDAFSGRNFRAAEELRSLAAEMEGWSKGVQHPDGNFDEGFSRGYKKGIDTGLQEARSAAEFMPVTDKCEADASVQNNAENPYCKAYALGYRIGYSDGYSNQRPPDSNLRTANGDK